MPAPPITIDLPDEAATIALAEALAPLLRAGDIVTLSGLIGAGKTTFARALIRTLAGDRALEVPSPTFTLVQPYGETSIPVAHFDLYRLADGVELDELGFDDAVAEGVALVEWPERAPGRFRGALAVSLVPAGAGAGRIATLDGDASWHERLATTVLR
ncbi:MAG: tRNA (adenosine(37)-N6)-threonylcarbamoyltransferase complex ATPase subunit type 1 TsaE [Bauldia sp.]|nr:tRNA (adenosine(37)-N6)-threonylcarbamoyltransferase complex ATPase subunit type 1 TsaE [Bauldia sp.]MCW5717500.1 tRNA (adenosine(37)-N6)-threonylcarbamoyltransferase complex ATPase subunit type 1 TsaE [Bauldia sp.]